MNVYDLINLEESDKEKMIQEAIKETKRNLPGLTDGLTCKIYSSYMTEQLRKRHVVNRKIDTSDLNCPYSHVFNLVPIDEKEYFLIDITYSQFQNNDFEDLLKNGYTRVDNDRFNDYLEITGKKNPQVSLDDAFMRIRKEKTL